MDYVLALKNSFRLFLKACWNHLRLPDPTPKQLEIADYLERGVKRRIIMAFRGIGKSWITAAYVLWRLYKDGDLKILVVSGTSKKADAAVNFIKAVIREWDLLKDLIPRKGQRDKANLFDVGTCKRIGQSASVTSTSITGTMTGGRADVIVFDDIETPENSFSNDMREKLHDSQREFEALLKPEPHAEIVGLGTPQTEESLYWQLNGYDYRIWPARVPEYSKVEASYKGFLAPSINKLSQEGHAGLPTDTRFDDNELTEKRLGYGAAGFALQFMLDTALSDEEKYPLKTSQFSVMPELIPGKGYSPINWTNQKHHQMELASVGFGGDRWYSPLQNADGYKLVPWERMIMAIDPSGRGKDETAWVIVGELLGKFYLVHSEASSDTGYDEALITKMAKQAKEWQVNKVYYEANFGDGMYGQIITPIFNKVYPVTIEEVKNYGASKEQRIIDTLEPVLSRHKMVTSEAVIKADLQAASTKKEKSLFYQMTHITREKGALKHDDRLDALAIAMAVFLEDMDIDMEEAIERYNEEMLERCADSFRSEINLNVDLSGNIMLGGDDIYEDWSDFAL